LKSALIYFDNVQSAGGFMKWNSMIGKFGMVALVFLSTGYSPWPAIHAAATVSTSNFAAGGALSSSTMNTNFSNVTTGLNKLNPNGWTNSGTDIGYTDGKIGMGIGVPLAMLHLSSTGGATRMLFGDLDQAAGSRLWRIGNYAGGNFGFMPVNDTDTTATNVLTLLRNGNVGVGTASPGAKLQINGDVALSASHYKLGFQTTDFDGWAAGYGVYNSTGVKSTAGGGTAAIAYQASGANAWLSFHVRNSTATNDTVTERMRIDGNGNVGIGTASPGATLHVVGRNYTNGFGSIDLNSGISSIALLLNSNGASNGGIQFQGLANTTVPASSTRSINIYGGSTTLELGDSNDDVSLSAGRVFVASSTGKVGIGQSNPQYELDIGGNYTIGNSNSSQAFIVRAGTGSYLSFQTGGANERMRIESTGAVGIGGAPDQQLSVNGNASKSGGGSWATFSDIRLKDDIKPFQYGLNQIMQIAPFFFRYKEGNAIDLRYRDSHPGISAQELQKIIPESVSNSSKGFLQFNQDYILWASVNAIKELKREKDAEVGKLKVALRQAQGDALSAQADAKKAEARAAKLEQKIALLEKGQERRLAALEAKISYVARK